MPNFFLQIYNLFKHKCSRVMLRFSFRKYHIKNAFDTIKYLIKSDSSFVRIGDGEVKWMTGRKYDSFEKESESMQLELLNLLHSNNKSIVIGLNSRMFLKRINVYSKHLKNYYYGFSRRYKQFLKQMIPPGVYLEASISWYYRETDKSTNHYIKYYSLIKKLWYRKKVLFVEGIGSKNGVGNDLFSDTLLIRRILCPDCYSYNKVDEIFDSIYHALVLCSYDLVLFSLGPTAKVLIGRLMKTNFKTRLFDIGALDLDYTFFSYNKKNPCNINIKNVPFISNECEEVLQLPFDENVYESQIIKRIPS